MGKSEREKLHVLKKYLDDHADFNMSWTDGRRGSESSQPEAYLNRRLEIAGEYKAWSASLERTFDHIDALERQVEKANGVIVVMADRDNEPRYHHQGMGCGLEDRNIRDRYEAMAHGWESAMERVYSEVIGAADEYLAEQAAITSVQGAKDASKV